jgi:hypothetical protein
MLLKSSKIALQAFIIAMLLTSAKAQDYSQGNAAPLFSSHQILQIIVRGDLQTITDDIGEERQEHPATLLYVTGSDTVALDVQISTRGNFRRKAENCVFPPLRINFKKKQVKGTVFDEINKIKLVTQCRPNSVAYEQYVLEEYLIYRVYNILTDTSFRVRLAQITYIDEGRKDKTWQSYAFFIEPDGDFGNRLHLAETKKKYLMQDSTQLHHINRLAVFQYFIGNTDWAITTLHNIKLFAADSLQRPYAIPYDFDWAGAISTDYAEPQPRFGIERVSDRLFRGQCRTMEEFKANFEFFKSKKAEIYALYEGFEPLRSRQRKDVLSYYEKFYETIDNDAMIKIEFIDNCLENQKQ